MSVVNGPRHESRSTSHSKAVAGPRSLIMRGIVTGERNKHAEEVGIVVRRGLLATDYQNAYQNHRLVDNGRLWRLVIHMRGVARWRAKTQRERAATTPR